MQAIDVSEKFFLRFGMPMLQKEFSDHLGDIAAGIAGRGSECFGCDDETSRDHDFSCGFALWIPRKTDEKIGFALQRAYTKICSKFPLVTTASSKLGSAERGVITTEDFFRRHLGFEGIPQNWQQWLYTPEYAFAECINGKVFYDGSGVFSSVRNTIRYDMPMDVKLKKLAAHAVLAAQSGQYNFMRCIKHGEIAAAEIALSEFARHIAAIVFLLNNSFAPYYKWMFRLMKHLPQLSNISSMLEILLTEKKDHSRRFETVENISSLITSAFKQYELSESSDEYLEAHAFDLMKKIKNREIRSLHIMDGC